MIHNQHGAGAGAIPHAEPTQRAHHAGCDAHGGWGVPLDGRALAHPSWRLTNCLGLGFPANAPRLHFARQDVIGWFLERTRREVGTSDQDVPYVVRSG